MQEICKFDVKINVIPNGLEKYMDCTINKSLVFIGSVQYMKSSLDALVKNLSDNDFKYLSQEFSGECLKLIKQKRMYPYEFMNSFKNFSDEQLPYISKFFSFLKDECISKKKIFTCY